ncbi:MAG: YfhO family protein [Bacteroidota bacterium]
MKNINFKKLIPHFSAILVFIAISLIYFWPVMDGKSLRQSDVVNAGGMQKEAQTYHEKTGEYTLWTNSMFGGMPTYQIGALPPSKNVYSYTENIVQLNLPRYTADTVFLYLIGFYILLLVLGINPWLCLIGAIAFAFGSYNLIIIEAGHVNKAYAIAFMAPVLAGILLTFKKKYIWGGLLTAFALGMEVFFNHLQIAYYLMFMIFILLISKFIYAIIEKQLKHFAIASIVLFFAVILAVLPNIRELWTTYEYGKETTRGQSELTPKGNQEQSSGLDKDYAFAWSYGKAESFTLLIPNFNGGSSHQELSEGSETAQVLKKNGISNVKDMLKGVQTYWGEQPFTSGPVYAGAIIVFLFVMGLFLVKGPEKWWLLTAAIFSLMLAWGKNFDAFNDFMFYNIPFYNKFRTVAMALVIASVAIPMLGLMAMNRIISKEVEKKDILKALKYSLGIVGGLCLLFAMLPTMFFDFSSTSDAAMLKQGFPDWFLAAIVSDRQSIFRMDALRSLVLILLSGGLIWAFLAQKIKSVYVLVGMGLLITFDVWAVDKRYLNDEDFVPKRKMVSDVQPTQADEMILMDKDPDYRVLNLTANTFNDASTSYYHKSIGGYHGAKLRRYQELIENQISKNNVKVFNMLNTRYFIVPGEKGEQQVQRNVAALGNAWFVDEYRLVANADSEMTALSNFEPAHTAIIDKRFADEVKALTPGKDTTSSITLTSYKPNDLVYASKADRQQLAVFSEIYYKNGWNAYVDGKLTPHFRANYVLRAMLIPAGVHTIEYKFEPKSFYTGDKLSLISSILVLLIFKNDIC